MTSAPAPAKINLALAVGPTREDGLHEVATILQRIELADTVDGRACAELSVDGLRGRHARPRARSWPSRTQQGRAALARARSRSGSRSRPASAAEAPMPRPRSGSRRAARAPAAARASPRPRPRPRRRRPVLPRVGPAARARRRRCARAGRPAAGLHRPAPASTRRAQAVDGRDLRRASTARSGFAERRARVLVAHARPRRRPARPPAERPRALAARPGLRALGAFRADVSGAGPAVYGLFRDRGAAEAAAAAISRPRARPGSQPQRGSLCLRCPPGLTSSTSRIAPAEGLRANRLKITLLDRGDRGRPDPSRADPAPRDLPARGHRDRVLRLRWPELQVDNRPVRRPGSSPPRS